MVRNNDSAAKPDTDINTHKLVLTIFRDETGSEKKEIKEFTLSQWQEHILSRSADDKDQLRWLKGAIFGNKRSEKGSFRTNENVKLITAPVVEYDGPRNGVEEPITFDEAKAIIEKARLRALLYTSPSHKTTAPRWRIIFPSSHHEGNPKVRHEALVAMANGLFNGQLAPESFTLSQAYYYGKVGDNPDHRVEIIDGDFLNLRSDLFAGRIYRDGGAMPRAERSQSKSKVRKGGDPNVWEKYADDMRRPADKDEVRFALSQISSDDYLIWMAVGAGLADEFDEEGFELFEPWSKKSEKYDKDECEEKYADFAEMTEYAIGTVFHLATEANPNWREEYRKQEEESDAAASAAFKQKKRAEEEEKTRAGIEKGDYTIKAYGDDLHKAVDLTEQCLLKHQSPFYVYAGRLMTPLVKKVRTMHEGEEATVAAFSEVEIEYLTDHANRFIDYQKFDLKEKEWKSIDPPQKVIARLLARAAKNLTGFPQVIGLITTPTMRPDGSLLLQAGYDEATGLLLINPPQIPDIPDKPTQQQAFAALTLLENLLDEFPFVDPVAKAVALSALITPIVRGAFPVCPLHVNRAPTPASGKSYLFDMVAAIAIGQRAMPTTAAGRNDEETEKRLGASLIAGQTLINIDNVNGELGGDALCQYIERPTVNVRILGKSENKSIDAGGTSLYATGNNIVLLGDITRRVLISTIDHKTERPELHEYKKQPVKIILKNRGQYIAACLTICKAYIAVRRPNKAKPLASFEDWSDTVRSALIWLGKEDVTKSMEIARSEDPDLINLRAMLSEWKTEIGYGYATRTTLEDIIEIATDKKGSKAGFDQFDCERPDFNAAIMRVASIYNRPPDLSRLRYWMRGHTGRVIDGMCFRSESGRRSTFWIEEVSAPDENLLGSYLKAQQQTEAELAKARTGNKTEADEPPF